MYYDRRGEGQKPPLTNSPNKNPRELNKPAVKTCMYASCMYYQKWGVRDV